MTGPGDLRAGDEAPARHPGQLSQGGPAPGSDFTPGDYEGIQVLQVIELAVWKVKPKAKRRQIQLNLVSFSIWQIEVGRMTQWNVMVRTGHRVFTKGA